MSDEYQKHGHMTRTRECHQSINQYHQLINNFQHLAHIALTIDTVLDMVTIIVCSGCMLAHASPLYRVCKCPVTIVRGKGTRCLTADPVPPFNTTYGTGVNVEKVEFPEFPYGSGAVNSLTFNNEEKWAALRHATRLHPMGLLYGNSGSVTSSLVTTWSLVLGGGVLDTTYQDYQYFVTFLT
ncbi:hypothetical protein FB45DRAFT_1006509 [Roridomyces roridus]|uniref:Uncharacterized protein n=1 Tax=Roridomyces roridus TaxID=1738132 RepID=A0AAD7BHI1_9AGAR|nr:hypothetical protein FB45DRAFT_1006509 [Roridomyces roridus]